MILVPKSKLLYSLLPLNFPLKYACYPIFCLELVLNFSEERARSDYSWQLPTKAKHRGRRQNRVTYHASKSSGVDEQQKMHVTKWHQKRTVYLSEEEAYLD